MYAKTITYEDYNGTTRTEEFFFNLNKTEVIGWLVQNGDYTLDAKLEQLSKENNNQEILKIFEDLVQMSCGKKSLDGRRFDKSPEAKADFLETEAYPKMLSEMLADAKVAADFINKIIPKDLSDEIEKMMKNNPEQFAVITGQ